MDKLLYYGTYQQRHFRRERGNIFQGQLKKNKQNLHDSWEAVAGGRHGCDRHVISGDKLARFHAVQ